MRVVGGAGHGPPRGSAPPLAAKESVPIYREESLTAKRARAIIIAAFPEFRGARMELLDEGWDFQVFEVDAGWLFRFPKREAGAGKVIFKVTSTQWSSHRR